MDIDYLLLTHGIQSKKNEENSIIPSPILNFNATMVEDSVQLSWVNPIDSIIGVQIQRKKDSYPESISDGITVFNGFATSYLDNSFTEEGVYYYRAFTYNTRGEFNNETSQQIFIRAEYAKIYTVIIDTLNSNPFTSVTYADNAIEMIGGSNSWDSIYPFSEIKPVMFKNGVVNYYLNPNNFAQRFDGTPVDIINGNDGDVMIQFPKFYTYIRKENNLIYISLSKVKVNNNFKCLAHTKGNIEKDYLYIGAYFAVNDNNRLRSVSGDIPSNSRSLLTNRTLAEANGDGYQLYSYYQHLMLQILYLIKYKNLDSQSAVGYGAGSSDNISAFPNGYLDSYGMTYGGNSYTIPMKLFGIENLWGNYYCFIDGFLFTSTKNYLVNTNNSSFNDDGNGYESYVAIIPNLDLCYSSNVYGNNELGFVGTSFSGSNSTYYCDLNVYPIQPYSSTRCAMAGMRFDQPDSKRGGIFYFDIIEDLTYTKSNTAARLVYV